VDQESESQLGEILGNISQAQCRNLADFFQDYAVRAMMRSVESEEYVPAAERARMAIEFRDVCKAAAQRQ
jgi:hypothetical protein